MEKVSAFLYAMRGRQDLALIALLMISVVVMIIPLPVLMIDVLIALNITITMLILILAVYLDRPTSFATFPSVILFTTTFRLAISISTTRTILTTAEGGAVVETFGNFVTGGNIIVGLIIFLIITVVQFMVITKGAERVAEVSARFVLDALPGRQLSIDAEARAGDITPEEARKRRKLLDKENQFFGSMDGAMKFVKGDAIAGLIIVAINLIGGIAIGTTQLGMSMGQAASTFTLLSIGDGMVAQIPALLLALCAGAVVTRVSSDVTSDLGKDIFKELIGSPRALFVAGSVTCLIGFVPGFPTLLFLLFGGGMAWYGYRLGGHEMVLADPSAASGAGAGAAAGTGAAAAAGGKTTTKKGKATQKAETIEAQQGERLIILVGETLWSRLNPADFIAAREAMRTELEKTIGFPIERFGVLPNPDLPPDDVALLLDNVPSLSGSIPNDMTAIEGAKKVVEVLGISTTELPRTWSLRGVSFISALDEDKVKEAGLPIVSPGDLIIRLAERLLRDQASQIIGFDDVQRLLVNLRRDSPTIADQMNQATTPAAITDVTRRLLEERVPIVWRTFFETMIEWGQREQDPAVIAEHLRRALRRQICNAIADQNRVIAAYVVEPDLENALREGLRPTESGIVLSLTSTLANTFFEVIEKATLAADPSAPDPVIVTSVDLRRHLAGYLRSHNIPLSVISFQEVAQEFQVQPVGTLSFVNDGVSLRQAA